MTNLENAYSTLADYISKFLQARGSDKDYYGQEVDFWRLAVTFWSQYPDEVRGEV